MKQEGLNQKMRGCLLQPLLGCGAGLTGLPRKIAEDCEPTPLGTLRSAYYLCEVACTLLHLIGSFLLSQAMSRWITMGAQMSQKVYYNLIQAA